MTTSQKLSLRLQWQDETADGITRSPFHEWAKTHTLREPYVGMYRVRAKTFIDDLKRKWRRLLRMPLPTRYEVLGVTLIALIWLGVVILLSGGPK